MRLTALVRGEAGRHELATALDALGVKPGDHFLIAHESVMDVRVPVAGTCTYCGEPVGQDGYRRIVGWERKTQGATRKGGSDIRCRERGAEWACSNCVDKEARGVNAGQGSLV